MTRTDESWYMGLTVVADECCLVSDDVAQRATNQFRSKGMIHGY